ncbi:hypothetical protein ACE6H2_027598 [Prunus campanulata]
MTFKNLNSTELKLEASETNEPAVSELDTAETTIQKFCRSYSTRRGLADCAVVADELWFLSPLCLEPEMNKSMESNGEAGVGPRIGWVREYPSELRFRALEQVRLSAQPQPKPTVRVSPRLSPKLNAGHSRQLNVD